MSPQAPSPESLLVRALGVRQLAASIVNNTVGAGIFVLPGAVAAGLGAAAPAAYLACAGLLTLVVTSFGLAGSRVSGHFLFQRAFQHAPASAITPYTYVQLVWSSIVGWIVFASFPDAWALTGMAIITGSGLLIALHEQRKSTTAVAAQATVVD